MIFINIISWNSIKYLPDALKSIFNQTYKNFSALVIDNGSTDGTVEFLRANFPQASILKNSKNLGSAAARNQGIKFVFNLCEKNNLNPEDNYILIMDSNIILSPDFLEKISARADILREGASFGGKILKIFHEDSAEDCPAGILDGAGLKIFKSGKIIERASGEEDKGQYDSEEEIFGVSRGLALYRLSALKTAEIKNGYFDRQYFESGADDDLAWRLRVFGFKSFYVGNAVARRHCGIYSGKKKSLKASLCEIRIKKGTSNYYSVANHLFTIFKNGFAANLAANFPRMFFYELSKFLYIIFFETKSSGAYWRFVKNFSGVLATRKEIMSRKKNCAEEMKKWFA
jgi:GT2 family glycosyltransferase